MMQSKCAEIALEEEERKLRQKVNTFDNESFAVFHVGHSAVLCKV